MVEHGLYSVKQELFKVIINIGGSCDMDNGHKRPTYCCIKDDKIDGLYWAIPTNDLSHRSDIQKEKYDLCLNRPDDDLRSCYYHIARQARYVVCLCIL